MHINPFVFVFSDTSPMMIYICPDNPCYDVREKMNPYIASFSGKFPSGKYADRHISSAIIDFYSLADFRFAYNSLNPTESQAASVGKRSKASNSKL